MAESILEQSRKAQILGRFGKKTKIAIIVVVLAAGAFLAYNHFFNSKSNRGQNTTVKTATATRGDIQLAVEADGKVTARDGVDLSFSTTGETVDKIYVKEGDMVKVGDKIASITTKSLEFQLKNAQSSYQSAVNNLNAKKAGPTSDQINSAQYQIQQAQIALDGAKSSLELTKSTAAQNEVSAQQAIQTAQNNLNLNQSADSSQIVDSAYQTYYNNISSADLTLQSVLLDSDKILGIDNTSYNTSFKNVLGALNSSTLYSAQNSYATVKQQKQQLDSELSGLTANSPKMSIETAGTQASTAAQSAKTHLENMQALLDATITSSSFSQTQLDGFKSDISSLRTNINSTISSLSGGVQSISSAKNSLSNLQITYDKAVANLDAVKQQDANNIANAEAQIQTKEIALESAQNSYNALIAPPKQTDLESLIIQVNQAKTNLDKAQYDVDRATLTSPIDGQVVLINGQVGDLISSNSSSSTAFATIMNKNTLFAEVNVEEGDISQIQLGQKAYVTFDAVNGLQLEGQVTFVSMTATTSSSGIVTYPVRVVLNDVGQSDVKEGMTAYVKFVSNEVKDVINIPVAAVKSVDGSPSVQLANGKYQTVVTGFTDGKSVEIISGLKEGDKVTY